MSEDNNNTPIWDLTEIISHYATNCICDWECGPFLTVENEPLFTTVIDMAKLLVMDEQMLKKYGNAGCTKLMNCLVDITLLSLAEYDFEDDEKLLDFARELTVCIHGLLTCRRYQPSYKNWLEEKL